MVRASTVPGPVSNWPFVGRSGELATFRTLLADPSSRGVLVYGPAGVGKTRLAEQFATIATGLGRACGRATGSATAATVPLGALAHLLPAAVGRERLDPVALVDRVAEAFRHRSGGAPFVVHADDLHLLDITSLTLLTQLIDAAAVFLIGTVRADEPVPDALSALWRGGRLARIDLTDLSRDGVEELLSAVLRGPVEAATVDDVYSIGRGNILFVRELVLGALAGGRLVTEHGVWRLTGPLASTAALAELVEANLRNVDPAARPVLELLALVGAAGLTGLAAMASADTLESLERAGLVLLRTDRRRQQVSLAHPLYGEVLRDRLPRLTRRRILLEHADRIEAFGARRRGDPLRIATWRLDALGTADPELLLSGARLARYGHDFAQVRRLAGAALAERVSDEGRLLLGEALYELGEFDEAEQMLSAAEQVVPVVATRVRNLTWGLLRPEEALAISRATRARVTDPVRHQELLAVEARVLTHAGRPAEALAALAALDAPGDRRTAVLRAVPHATALVMTGRCVDGLAVARAGFAEQGELSDQLAMVHPSTHLVIEAYALAEAGDLPGAAERAASGRRLAVRDRSTIGRIWFAYHLGRCALLTGQVRTARRWFAEAVALCRDHGYPWPRRLAVSFLAVADAVTGDVVAARQALAEAAMLGDIGFLDAEQELGPAWLAAATGDLGQARAVLLTAADKAAAAGQLSSAAWLLHDVVRLGDPARVRDTLAALAERCQGRLVRGYAMHARAASAGDPDALARVVAHFEALGALLYAAEAAVVAGDAYQRHGRPRPALRLRAQAAALARRCPGARTPGLAMAATITPLTRREHEVAILAARGVPSKGIAATLHLSTRTVDNHLQNIYGKLGVAGRAELAAALGDTEPR